MKTKIGTVFFMATLSFCLVVSATLFQINLDFVEPLYPTSNKVSNDLIPHDAIELMNDEDFIEQALLEEWPGNGTAANPYIIENYYIDSDSCITMYDVSLHFTIRNCMLISTYTTPTTSSTYGTSGFTFVMDKLASYRSGVGIKLERVKNAAIDSCYITNKTIGIRLWSSSDCRLFNNTVYGGIDVYASLNCNFTSNHLYTSGLGLWGPTIDHWEHNIVDNWYEEKSVAYYWNTSDTSIDGTSFTQLILANCQNVTAQNGIYHSKRDGVSVAYSSNCVLEDLQVLGNNFGILVEFSDSTVIRNCELEHNNFGIMVNVSSHCEIISNTITGGVDGIYPILADNCEMAFNTITGCSRVGIYDNYNQNSFIHNNTLADNENALYVYSSTGIRVIGNTVANNSVGVDINRFSSNITVYSNILVYNSVTNAQDNGQDNYWDDGIRQGNTWSDYSGTGVYTIPGTAGSIDHYPEGYSGPIVTSGTTPTTNTTESPTSDYSGIIITTSIVLGGGICVIIVVVMIKRRPV